MWDSARQEFPPGSKLNALYYNGAYAHKPYSVGPGKVWIDVFGTAPDQCGILQIDGTTEAGIEHMIGICRTWANKRRVIATPTIYCNRSNLAQVQEKMKGLTWYLWLSTLDGAIPASVAGGGTLAAVQYQGANLTGLNADKSAVISETWWKLHASK